MIRVALAVVFAAALLSVGLQAATTGSRHHAATLADDRVASLSSTVEGFAAHNDPVPPGREGATLVTRVRVPDGVVIVVGTTSDAARDRIAWHPVGAATGRHVRWVEADLRGPAGERQLRLRAGRHRLRLSLARIGGRPVVVVRRFTAEGGTTRRHVRPRFGGRRGLSV